MAQTLTYSERNKGWTGEAPFTPGSMTSLNNRFYSFKNGQLFLHNDRENPTRCNFYGVQYTPRIKTVFNDSPESDKVYKTLVLEGDKKWKATVETNFVKSTVRTNEFVTKESREFAYLRQAEAEDNFRGGDVQGIGSIEFIEPDSEQINSPTIIKVSKIPDNTNIGDALFQVNGEETELIGVISAYTKDTITINSINQTPQENAYCFVRKVARIEGAEIRGYYMEVTLELESTENAELFAITTNAIKSGI
jgi:hypothetical protein